MGYVSSIIEFRPILIRISEYHHFEEQLWTGLHNPRQNRWLQWPESTRRSGERSVCLGESDLFFWAFTSSRLTFFLKRVFWMILFSAEAILASSNSKFGPGVPLIEREDMISSTDSTISTSLIHDIASVENCEQIHTSNLNLIFPQANVVGVGNLSKWRSAICSPCWSAPQSFENLPSVGSNEFLAEGADWHIQSCVWVLAFTRYMRWCVFRYVRNPRIESSWIRWWRRRRWIYKTFPDIPYVFQISGGLSLRLSIPTERLSISPGSR